MKRNLSLSIASCNAPFRWSKALSSALTLLWLAAGLSLAACNAANANYCDVDTPCTADSTTSFCDIAGVYADSKTGNTCIAQPQANACNEASACTNSATPVCSDPSKGICLECAQDSDCSDGKSCDTRSGVCTQDRIYVCDAASSGDADCAAKNVGLNYCNVDMCVACLTSAHCTTAAAAVCDEPLLECRACTANSECDSELCGEFAAGECVPTARMIYVSKAGATSGSCGDKANPCALIRDAMALVSGERNVILVGGGSYAERLVIAGKSLTVVAGGGVTLNPATIGFGNLVDVSGASNVTIDGVTLNPANGDSNSSIVACAGSGPSLLIKNSTLANSSDVGLTSTGCTVKLSNTEVRNNSGIGLTIIGGTLELNDSNVNNNNGGGEAIYVGGVSIRGGAQLTMTNSKILGNGGEGIEISSEGGSLHIEGSSIRDNSGIGIVILSGSLDFVRSDITDNRGEYGIFADRCSVSIKESTLRNSGQGIAHFTGSLTIERSLVADNRKGGLDVSNVDYSVVNSFIVNNGSSTSTIGGARINSQSFFGEPPKSEKFDFNTVAGNTNSGTSGHAIRCRSSHLVAANNIFMLASGSTAGLLNGCDTATSLVDPDSSGNSGVHTDSVLANAEFVNAPNSDFHLAPGSPGINAASQAATLDVDYDGDLRPQGGRRDMGADEAE